MGGRRQRQYWKRRLQEIEREKLRVCQQLEELRRVLGPDPEAWREAVSATGSAHSAAEEAHVVGADMPRAARGGPAGEEVAELGPGPAGLKIQRVVLPPVQRTDLLRPPLRGGTAVPHVADSQAARFRSYFGAGGLQPARLDRREKGNPRLRTFFLVMMVIVLSVVLFQLIT